MILRVFHFNRLLLNYEIIPLLKTMPIAHSVLLSKSKGFAARDHVKMTFLLVNYIGEITCKQC